MGSDSKDISSQDIPSIDIRDLNTILTQYIRIGFVCNFLLSYSSFPASILCALNAFKCGLSMEHRQECDHLVWYNKILCFFAFAKCTFQGIISKYHFARYFVIRDRDISRGKTILFGSQSKKKK